MKPFVAGFFLPAGFLLLSILSHAQDLRFIEITVSDTVTVKPAQFIYQITTGQKWTEYMGVQMPKENDESETNEPAVELAVITTILDKEKFTYTISNENKYSVTSYESKPEITVVLNGEAELKKLVELLKLHKGINGKIKDIIYEPSSEQQDSAYRELYTKALKQARLMAKISGNSIGKLISISDVRNESFAEMLEELIKAIPKGLYAEKEIANKKVEIKMIYKFELL